MERVELTYAYDAYCGWCYGYGPTLQQFVADNAHRIDLRIISGGLFTGPRIQPMSQHSYILAAAQRITQLTGVSFGQPFLDVLSAGRFMMDSTGLAIGIVALRRQAPDRTLEFASALQRVFFQLGRDLSAPDTYWDLAVELGLNAAAVVNALDDPAVWAEAQEDFRETRRLGIEGFPTLLLHTDGRARRLGGVGSSAAVLTRALDEALRAEAMRTAMAIR